MMDESVGPNSLCQLEAACSAEMYDNARLPAQKGFRSREYETAAGQGERALLGPEAAHSSPSCQCEQLITASMQAGHGHSTFSIARSRVYPSSSDSADMLSSGELLSGGHLLGPSGRDVGCPPSTRQNSARVGVLGQEVPGCCVHHHDLAIRTPAPGLSFSGVETPMSSVPSFTVASSASSFDYSPQALQHRNMHAGGGPQWAAPGQGMLPRPEILPSSSMEFDPQPLVPVIQRQPRAPSNRTSLDHSARHVSEPVMAVPQPMHGLPNARHLNRLSAPMGRDQLPGNRGSSLPHGARGTSTVGRASTGSRHSSSTTSSQGAHSHREAEQGQAIHGDKKSGRRRSLASRLKDAMIGMLTPEYEFEYLEPNISKPRKPHRTA